MAVKIKIIVFWHVGSYTIYFFDSGVICKTLLMCITTFSIITVYKAYNVMFHKQFAFEMLCCVLYTQ